MTHSPHRVTCSAVGSAQVIHTFAGNLPAPAMHGSHKNAPSTPQWTHAMGIKKSTTVLIAFDAAVIIGDGTYDPTSIKSTTILVDRYRTFGKYGVEVQFRFGRELFDAA